MVDVVSKRCDHDGCKKQPHYNHPNEKQGLYCNDHKLEGMVNVIHKRCISCNLFIVIQKPHICSFCNPHSNKRQKTSEMILYNFLTDEKVEFIHNKSVGYVCGNYRPDFLIDCGTHFIVIENDEDQHKQYERECEQIRMYNIEQALGLRCHFIRYNPDAYRVNGLTQRIPRKQRMKVILNEVNQFRTIVPTPAELSVKYLFYDC